MPMARMSANDAKARFGQLLDAAQRAPVTIEKHGRAVAVVLSSEDYEELQAMKLERLRAAVDVGIDQLARGKGIDYDRRGLRELGARIKAEGRKKAGA